MIREAGSLPFQSQAMPPKTSFRGVGLPYFQPGRLALLKSLQNYYGEDQVEWRSNSSILIFASPAGTNMRLAMVLTHEQAEFLSRNPLTPDDLIARRYPTGWPTTL